jgi:chaperonin GroEL
MAYRVAKSNAKMFITKGPRLQQLVINTMERISDAVSSSLGPSGRPTLIESDLPGIPPKITKDGVSIFKSLGAQDSYEHLIIETALSACIRSANEAGDGTTTTALLGYELIRNIFSYCEKNKKKSPQACVRSIKKVMEEILLPYIKSRSTVITEDNKPLLTAVAKTSANGDTEMADSVIKCFDLLGYSDGSHITLREASGPSGYKVELIEGYPMPIGLEESSGRYFSSFINDQGNQRCYLENPKFILFDGAIQDLLSLSPLFNSIEARIQTDPNAAKELKNIVLVANGFSETVISTLAFNFEQTGTLRILPLKAPLAQFMNALANRFGCLYRS